MFASLKALRANEELEMDVTMSELMTTKDAPLYIVVPSFKKRKTTEDYSFEVVPFQPILASPKVGDVVTVIRSGEETTVNMPLYIRQHLVDKLDELKEKFEETALLRLYATGAPGCGKTCFFWMWALMKMQQGKRLMFVQYRDKPSIWILENQTLKKMESPEYPMVDSPEKRKDVAKKLLKVVTKVLNQRTKKYDFGILDGELHECGDLVYVFTRGTGTKNSKIFSKSLFVTSLQYGNSRGFQPQGSLFGATLDMSFDSWKESDYHEAAEVAAQHDIISAILLKDWELLKTGSESNDLPNAEKVKQAITLKYDIAGGSARYMFALGLTVVERVLNDAMQQMGETQWEELATNRVPSKADSLVNSLMQRFRHQNDTYYIPVSKYVLRRAYANCRGTLAVSVASAAKRTDNPSLKGWAFEIAEINKFELALDANQQARHTGEDWSAIEARILPSVAGRKNELVLCPQHEAKYDGIELDGQVMNDTVIWNTQWNPGCFDFAYYFNSKLVTFQITSRETSHSLKLQYVKDLREALLEKGVPLAPDFTDGNAGDARENNENDVVHLGVLKGDAERFSFATAEGTGGLATRRMYLAFCVTVVKSRVLEVIKTRIGTSSICYIDAGQERKQMYKTRALEVAVVENNETRRNEEKN